MSDFSEPILKQKYQDALRSFKGSGPSTAKENALSVKAALAVVETLKTSAEKLIEYGVSEEQAYTMIFKSATDDMLRTMMQALWRALRVSHGI